jgi:hypothetical protein
MTVQVYEDDIITLAGQIHFMDGSDTLVIGRDAMLTGTSEVIAAIGVAGSGNIIHVDGQLWRAASGGAPGAINGSAAGTEILVGLDGRIISSSVAIDLSGTGGRVHNQGQISANGFAVQLAGNGAAVDNSGVITSFSSSAVIMGAGSLVNTGRISGLTGISNGSGSGLTLNILNSGTITGAPFAIFAIATTDLLNTGLISGDVLVQSGQDAVTNTGQLRGNVRLGSGDDRFDGSGGVNFGAVFGEAGHDTLIGGARGETLVGGAGRDALDGGAGFDFASYQDASAGVTANLADAVLNTGEALGDEYVSIEGLIGSAHRDVLSGNAGSNTIDGRAGADHMAGGAGNDTYIVDNAGDRVQELVGQGTDTIRSSSTFALQSAGAGVERLFLTGTGNINGTGDGFANRITGNDGANVLDGRAGRDALTGDQGADTFRFTAPVSVLNSDRIVDFSVADDTISLENAAFVGLPVGALAAGAFRIGAAAGDANDRIIYNSGSGALLFDRDGTGPIAAVQFAVATAGLALASNDFVVT